MIRASLLIVLGALVGAAVAAAQSPIDPPPLVAFEVRESAIPVSLTAQAGDPVRGRAVVLNRAESSCVLCHAVPDSKEPTGTIGPPLAGAGARLNPGQLRLRLVDSTRLNPDSPMPAYYRVDGLTRVASAYQGKPILSAQQIEDIVAYLAGLKELPQ